MNKFTSDLTLDAGVKGGMFSASVKLELGFEKTVTQEWHEEYEETVQETFQEGFTYVDWVLAEEIIVTHTLALGRKWKRANEINWIRELPPKSRSVENIIVYRPEKFAMNSYSALTPSSTTGYIVSSFDDMSKAKSEQQSKIFSNIKEASKYLEVLESQNTQSEFLLLPYTDLTSSTGEVKVTAISNWHGSKAEAEGECEDELEDKIADESEDLEREGKKIISAETEGFDMDTKEIDGELFYKMTGNAIIKWKSTE